MKYESLFEEGSLWVLIAVPSIWAAHFLISYWAAAVWCTKIVADGGSLVPLQIGIGALTVVALLAILWLARHAASRYQGELGLDDGLTESSEVHRTRFLGHAALLLCMLSAVAVIFDAVPVVLNPSCR